jgi:hypothetical protein
MLPNLPVVHVLKGQSQERKEFYKYELKTFTESLSSDLSLSVFSSYWLQEKNLPKCYNSISIGLAIRESNPSPLYSMPMLFYLSPTARPGH